MDKTALQELLERVKAATGPDDDGSNPDWRMRRRDLDGALWALGFEVVRDSHRQHPYWEPTPDVSWELVPQVTASIDAALALVERCLPEANCKGVEYEPAHGWSAYVSRNNVSSGHWMKEAYAPTAPLAILAALLAAIVAQVAP